jgi:hypothetical protein
MMNRGFFYGASHWLASATSFTYVSHPEKTAFIFAPESDPANDSYKRCADPKSMERSPLASARRIKILSGWFPMISPQLNVVGKGKKV